MRERTQRIKAMRCEACVIDGRYDVCGASEEHHLNFDGKAGQKRRGNDETIVLGSWHHRAVPKRGWTARKMTDVYGPSLAMQSKAFRERYGTDDELLKRVNDRMGIS